MAFNSRVKQAPGRSNPFVTLNPSNIIANRAPTVHDKYEVGTIWIYSSVNAVWALTSYFAGNAIWTFLVSAAGNIDTLTGNSGGPVGPTAANVNIVATSGLGLTFVGNPGTSTLTLQGTLAVAHGGTGDSSLTAYSVLCGGTTSTGNVQSVASLGTSGQVLTSNGAAALPTWQSVSGGISSVVVQTFTSSGTYTPTAGMAYCTIEAVGGGGGGGATSSGGTEIGYAGGGGGGGGYSRLTASAATIGVSQTVTIGAAGAGGTSGGDGGAGGDTTVGALITGGGGQGGKNSSSTSDIVTLGGAGGVGASGDINTNGGTGFSGFWNGGNWSISGAGGTSFFGGGASAVGASTGNGVNGVAGSIYGSGGSGAANTTGDGSARNGGAGAAGVVIITEYVA